MNSRRSSSSPFVRRGLIVRIAYLLVSMLWWMVMRIRSDHRTRSVVLCYHNVTKLQRSRFAWQVRWISKRAIRTDQLGLSGSSKRPPVCMTFDDAFASLLDHAIPELEARGVPATIFAVTGNPGRPPQWEMPPHHPDSQVQTMTVKQLIDLDRNALFSVESHTVSHVALDQESHGGLMRQLSEARRELETLLGRPVRELALPFGRYNFKTLEAARVAGYDRVYALGDRMADTTAGFSLVNRFSVSPDMWRIEFLLVASGAYGWLHGWRRMLQRTRKITFREAKTPEIAEVGS